MGFHESMYNCTLLNGEEIPMNKKKAAHYLKMAADLGNIYACHQYSMMLYSGDGIKIDKVESAKYLKKAADLDSLLLYSL